MRSLKTNPSFRVLYLASLAFSVTGCMAESPLALQAQQGSQWGMVPAGYTHAYTPQRRAPGSYVQLAQNNADRRLQHLLPSLQHLDGNMPQYYQARTHNSYGPAAVSPKPAVDLVYQLQGGPSGLARPPMAKQLPAARVPVARVQASPITASPVLVKPNFIYQLDEGRSAAPRPYEVRPQANPVPAKPNFIYQRDTSAIAAPQPYIAPSHAKPVGEAHAAGQIIAPAQATPAQLAAAEYYRSKYAAKTRTSETKVPGTYIQNPPTNFVNSINQSVSQAQKGSPRLAIEDIKVQEAQEGLIQAEAQGRLRLSFDSLVGVTQSETDFTVVERTDSDTRLQRSASLGASLPIYQGGRLRAQKNVAKTGIKAAVANSDIVKNSVTQEAIIAHLNVIRDRELVELYARNVELLKTQKQTVQALLGAGENTVTDEALIDARLASIMVRLEQSKADLAASKSNYKKLVGRPAPSLGPVDTVSLPESLQEIKAFAQDNNAQIKAVGVQAEAAFHEVAVAKSFGKPQLSLQGALRAAEGQSETIRRNSAAEVLLNLSVPLLSGGENKSRVRQAALAQSRVALETREMRDNLNERLEQLWASVQAARRSRGPNQAQKLAAEKAFTAIQTQRNAGLATSLDVLSVEQTLLDAEINLLQSRNIEDVSRYQLLGLMGAL